MEHEHTGRCAEQSRYVLVRVSVVIPARGRTSVRVDMKPGASCWADVTTVASAYTGPLSSGMPRSPEEAAEVACNAIREAYPGLF